MKYWMGFLVLNLCLIMSMYFLQNKKIDFTDKRLCGCYIFSVIFLILSYEISPVSFRAVNNIIIHILLVRILFNLCAKDCFILGIFIDLLLIIIEIIVALFLSFFMKIQIFVFSDIITVILTNTLIGIMLCIITKLKYTKKIYNTVKTKINMVKENKVIIISILFALLFNLFSILSYFSSLELYKSQSFVFLGSILGIFSSVMLFVFLKENNKYVEISEKYNVSLDNIKSYEDMIEINRVNNHEVRNQFLMLRGMSKNKKLNTYIDSILDKNISTNEDLLNKVIKIPSGGLRGLIYTKLIQMQDNNINYEVYVDKRVNSRKFSKIDSNTMIDICKIVGVFIDNAIECVSDLKKKNITIEIYVERNDIIICITNNFEGKIDFDKLGTGDYTTKGNGHGYGLRLVKEILNSNNYLENTRELYDDNFTQNLKIKM